MTDIGALSRRRSLNNEGTVGNQHKPVQAASFESTIAVARDNARQHVGNVIHNYFGTSQRDEYQRHWLEVIEWLIPLKAATDLQTLIYTESRNKHDPDTGLWFTRGNALNRWISREEPLRWLCGSVGCGKTVLFSTAVEETRKKCRVDQGTRFGYFYCSSRDASGQDLEVLLRLLLVQLSPPSRISEPLQSLFNLCNDVYPPKTPTFTELKDCLRYVVELYAKTTDVYLLIDALDEIPLESRDDVFDILNAIAGQQLLCLHLLVTSRDHADIRQALTKPLDWNEVVVEEHLVQADIGRYVSNTIEGDRKLRSLKSNLKQDILQRVAVEGGGMFLWASLSLKALKSIRVLSDDRIRQCLKDLPPDLPKTYLKILCSIDTYFIPHASRALAWLVFSARRMYIEELADACSFEIAKASFLEKRLKPANIYELLGDIITIQPPLSPGEENFRPRYHTAILAHASVGEFLLRKLPSSSLEFPEQATAFLLEKKTANLLIAQSCLAYLFWYNSLEKRMEDHPLRLYAWYNWDKHITIEDDENYAVRDSYVIRHRALQLYRALDFLEIDSDARTSLIDGDYLRQLNAIEEAIAWLSDLTSLPRLKEAMNVPFFHEKFDCMYATGYPIGDMQHYKHDPLEHASGKPIRLLEVLPCLDDTSTPRGALTHTTLEAAPRYIALSYQWGSPEIAEDDEDLLQVRPVDPRRRYWPGVMVNGLATYVRPNLLRIFRLLRSRIEESQPAIWVDAICINQQDALEKGHQVAIIGEIFANARDVVVGLNDTSGTAEQGIEYLGKIVAAANARGSQDREPERAMSDAVVVLEKANAWDAVFGLFSDTWWQRMWIVQEVVLASNAIFLVGSASFSFKAVEDVMRAEPLIRTVLSRLNSRHLHQFIDDLGWTAAKNILQTKLECAQPRRPSLPVLFWRFRNHRCTLIQEKIFALLAMCDPQSTPGDNFVNYRHSAVRVYGTFLHWYIDKYHNLDILSLSIPYQQDSWAGYSRRGQYEVPHWYAQIFSNKYNDVANECRPLVLGTFQGMRAMDIYTAGGDRTVPQMVSRFTDEESNMIVLHGIGFDRVIEIIATPRDDSKQPDISKLSLQVLRAYLRYNSAASTRSAMEIFWRTLLADQRPIGQRLSSSSGMQSKIIPTCEADEIKLVQTLKVNYDVPFLTGRSIAITLKGRMGLVPQRAQIGDEIVVLPGGAVPYLLRDLRDIILAPRNSIPGTGNSNPSHKLIGECYIDGCMDGEIPKQLAPETGNYWSDAFFLK